MDHHEEDERAGQSQFEFLRDARERASSGSPLELTVRDLLSRWDAAGRRTPAATERLEADLENHRLTTVPNFRKIGLDSLVRVDERPLEAEPGPSIDGDESLDGERASLDEVGLTLGDIPSANLGIEAITPQAIYEEAITRMLLNDYSQLAVMTGERSIPHAVTWQSIARARHANPDGSLTEAIISATTLRFDTELIDVLPILETEDFLFVKDNTNRLTGIVTTADVVRAYGELATPFFLVGELDYLLRQVIADNFGLDEVTAMCDTDGSRNLQSYDTLRMGDYQRVLEHTAHWETQGWPLDRSTFVDRLSALRKIRNDLMRFNPDPVLDSTVRQLRHMIQLLRRHGFS